MANLHVMNGVEVGVVFHYEHLFDAKSLDHLIQAKRLMSLWYMGKNDTLKWKSAQVVHIPNHKLRHDTRLCPCFLSSPNVFYIFKYHVCTPTMR